jgi:hypothetical protein
MNMLGAPKYTVNSPVQRSKNNDAIILQHLEILLVEMIKSTILGVLHNQKHIRTLTQIWETQQTTHRVPCTLEIKTTVVFTFLLRPALHNLSHTTVRARDQWKAAWLTDWIQSDGVIAAAPATLDPAPRTCTSRRSGVVRHACDGGEGREGGGGGAQIGAGVGALGRMHIDSARGIFDNAALVGDDG